MPQNTGPTMPSDSFAIEPRLSAWQSTLTIPYGAANWAPCQKLAHEWLCCQRLKSCSLDDLIIILPQLSGCTFEVPYYSRLTNEHPRVRAIGNGYTIRNALWGITSFSLSPMDNGEGKVAQLYTPPPPPSCSLASSPGSSVFLSST